MDFLKNVKIKCIESDITLQELLARYNKTYQTSVGYSSFYRKLKEGTIKYTEYAQILAVLGYELIETKKQSN